ncbi:PorP/SprF family type IX secretion system membrane protein [Membranicola marinus]|uniref:PorP/SprF family type IX secretion system membrane protein n=1 Tax=Membranihabitans marinus TaxID=1227546 RepID=A0A953HLP1_9BACT|nr:PorP/SprF family type IX secretion system membrane protein [Membranihabitans marinus]MBY5957952.1 PorP/SprF family type IX secretion system membrane protein [Membranihabitans marinus]
MNKLLRYITATVLILTIGKLTAQEAGSHQHYKINYHLINPGATGMDGQTIMLNYISRWNAFPGNPQTFTAGYNGLVSDKIGLGAMVISDNLGSLNKTSGVLSYAYQFDVEETRLSIGLSTGYERNKLQASALVDQGLDPNDPVIDQAARGYDVFDASFGVHALLPDGFFAGAALPNLIRTRVDSDADSAEEENTLFKYFIGYAGYRKELEEYNFDIEPSLAIRKVRHAPFQVDLNMLGYYADDQLIGGFTYSIGGGNSAHVLLGTRINLMTIMYSYGVSFSDFQTYSNGSHEISLKFDLAHQENDSNGSKKR